MQNQDRSAEVGEIVSAIARFSPAALNQLKMRHPDQEIMFRPGGVLGGSGTSSLQCELALTMLAEYAQAAAGITAKLRRRLNASWWLDFVAKLLATSGAGATVAAFLSGLSSDQGLRAGVVALLGSGCSLLFSLLQRDAAGGSLTGSYNKLIEALVGADEQRRALQLLCPAGASAELSSVISKANDLARVLNEMALRYGR